MKAENILEGTPRLVCEGIWMRLGTRNGARGGLGGIGLGLQLVLVSLCPCKPEEVVVNSPKSLPGLSLAPVMI